MATVVVIGLGSFGCRVVQELIEHKNADLIILDKDREIVEKYKSFALNAFICDALNEETLGRIVPKDADAVVVDLSNSLETSILVTNHLKNIGIKQIIVKAKSDEHGNILKLVGASKIIYPDLDAAQNITPVIICKDLFSYIEISSNFAIAEVGLIKGFENKTLLEISFRQKFNLNVIGIKKDENAKIEIPKPNDILKENYILVVAGTPDAIKNYSEKHRNINKDNSNKGFIFKMLSSKG